MAMVIEEMKASEEVPTPRSNVAQASDALIALVRGTKRKSAASMLGVTKADHTKDFVPSDPKPKGKAVLMMPRPWGKAQEFRPRNTSSSSQDPSQDPTTSDEEMNSNSIGNIIEHVEKDEVEKMKNDKNGSPVNQRPLKSDGQEQKCLGGKICKFRAKENEFEPGSFGSALFYYNRSIALEEETSEGQSTESGSVGASDQQVKEEPKRKTGNPKDSIEDPNQVRVTLTTLRNAQGQITGTRSSRSLLVPAQLDMNPPDLSALTTGDEEYLLIRVSKERKKMWVSYLNGDDPDEEHEFYWGQSVSYLVERDRTTERHTSPRSERSSGLPNPSRPNQKGEVMGHERAEQLKKSTRGGTHTRSRRQASESGGESCVPRAAATHRDDLTDLTRHFNPFERSPSVDDLTKSSESKPARKRRGLKESCKTISPSSPNTTPSYLVPREQWLRENDNRTDEQADADWRRVTESIFGANTGANPRVEEQKEHGEHLKFVPNWGNDGISQERIDDEKRGAAEWKTKRGAEERIAVDKARKGGGSPLRGNRNSKSTFLDEIDDPNYDYMKVRAKGYQDSLRSGWEDVYVHEEEMNEKTSASTHPKRASPSSAT